MSYYHFLAKMLYPFCKKPAINNKNNIKIKKNFIDIGTIFTNEGIGFNVLCRDHRPSIYLWKVLQLQSRRTTFPGFLLESIPTFAVPFI